MNWKTLKPKTKFAIGVAGVSFLAGIILGHLYFYIGIAIMLVFMVTGLREQFKNDSSNDNHVRGSKLLSNQDSEKTLQLRKAMSMPDRIKFGGRFKIPHEKETSHGLIIGCSGSGKTNVFSWMLDGLRSNNLKAIIHDTKGDYISKFYSDGDFILNPLDERCVKWNIWNDITRHSDFVTIANTLIPENTKGDPFFYLTPRRILVDILQYLWDTEQTTNKAIWDIVNQPMQELGKKLQENGLSAGNDLLGNQETASNIMSTVVNACQVFRYMQDMDGDFSIHDYINNSTSWMFLSNKQEIKELVKPILALFCDFVTNYLLSLPDDRKRRVFFMLDEFNSMAKMSSIISLLTLARSKGGAVYIGTQDFGEIDSNYGENIRNTIINNCSNTFVLRLNDPVTADYFSQKIGEMEWMDTVYSESESTSTTAGVIPTTTVTKGKSDSRRIDRVVLPSELLNLPNLDGYVIISGLGITKTRTFFYKQENVALPFIEKPLTRLRKPVKLDDLE